ncbi:hypothetical protein ADA01nite_19990 [Aneurinibacillus danicus]|uniref:Uncharacterized protein n=1 Tax=Aneurinibacillus danicus TaxID=267746 RepID=A0A511V6Z2_9BACL|nr:hypothetical protein ADA01nite_19990 [Aneurinibacillus danicus]
MVSPLEVPGCFAGPTEGPQSGRLSFVWKKDERHRPRVFLIMNKLKAGKELEN